MAVYDTVNSYNSYEGFSNLSYNIITALFENETIWKLLCYTDSEALSHANLTPEQKASLVWAGEENQQDFTVYLVPLAENIEYTSKVILKIYCANIKPQNQLVGDMLYVLEIMCQSRVSMLADRRARAEVLLEEILKTVNGREVGGASELYFNSGDDGDSECGADIAIDQKRNYCGYVTVFGVHYGNIKNRPTNPR